LLKTYKSLNSHFFHFYALIRRHDTTQIDTRRKQSFGKLGAKKRCAVPFWVIHLTPPIGKTFHRDSSSNSLLSHTEAIHRDSSSNSLLSHTEAIQPTSLAALQLDALCSLIHNTLPFN